MTVTMMPTTPATAPTTGRTDVLDRADRLVGAGAILVVLGFAAWQLGPGSVAAWILAAAVSGNGVAFLLVGGALGRAARRAPLQTSSAP